MTTRSKTELYLETCDKTGRNKTVTLSFRQRRKGRWYLSKTRQDPVLLSAPCVESQTRPVLLGVTAFSIVSPPSLASRGSQHSAQMKPIWMLWGLGSKKVTATAKEEEIW